MSTEPAAKVWLKQGLAFMAYLWRRFVDDRCLGIAATLSYTSLLALVPLAAIAVTVLAAFPVFEGAREGIHGFIFANFMPDTGEPSWNPADESEFQRLPLCYRAAFAAMVRQWGRVIGSVLPAPAWRILH